MTKVWFTTNYSMSLGRQLVQRGVYPSQRLYGALALEAAGHDVVFGPFNESAALARASKWSRRAFGQLGDEAHVLRHRTSEDVCYAADHHSFRGLALLRSRGLLSSPVVTVFHHAPDDRAAPRSAVLGPDFVVCMTREVHAALLSMGRPPDTTAVGRWGPDLTFSGYRSTGSDVIVSCGKTNRDVACLLAALERVDYPAVVYARGSKVPAPLNVIVVDLTAENRLHLTYEETLPDLARASVVAIPLLEPRGLSGLSELNDALALGKPVVMTRSPAIDVDIEAIGCGVWVGANDPEAWVEALDRVLSDEERRSAMGRAGRAFAEEHWNAEFFNRTVVNAVRTVSS